MDIMTGKTAALKFNRCIEFTLPDGRKIVAKVLGEKAPANLDALALVAALKG